MCLVRLFYDLKNSTTLVMRVSQNYCCASYSSHYGLYIRDHGSTFSLINERVNIYFDKKRYSIIKSYGNTKPEAFIVTSKVDGELREIFEFSENKISIDPNFFDFKNFDKERAISRIKAILLFS